MIVRTRCSVNLVNPDGNELIRVVRQTIYERTVATGHLPTAQEVAGASGIDSADVLAAFQTLADTHVVVLKPGTSLLWSAPPFAADPTSFRVHAGGGAWYAPCAWDSFGIAAALNLSAAIETRCAWSGQPVPAAVKDGRAVGAGVVHFEVPAKHFWDDIFYT